MPSGRQMRSLCSGLVCRSSSECLKFQIFQMKVDSSKAQVAVPGARLVRAPASGHVSSSVRTAKRTRASSAQR